MAFKVDTYRQVHREGTVVELTEILEVFAEAFGTPPPQESSSDESMPEETASQRLARYRNASQGEISDPDEWASIHYGPPDPVDGETEEF